MQLVTGPRVWATIAELARGAKRTRAVVSRLETGASELLPLGEGSSLVVDLSPHALSQGQTSPDELHAYLERGVEVFRWNGLHANVYLFDRTVILGSAGVSQRSARALTEAVVASRDPALIGDVRAFIDSVSKVRLTRDDLEHAREAYQKPAAPPRTNDTNPVGDDLLPRGPHRMWLCEYADQPWPKPIFDAFEADERLMSLRAGDRRRFVLYPFLLWGPTALRIEEGDVVVCAWCDEPGDEPQAVWPPGVVIGKRAVKGRDREGVVLFTRFARALDPVAWEEYRDNAASAGVRLRTPLSRAVRTPQERKVLLAPWGLD